MITRDARDTIKPIEKIIAEDLEWRSERDFLKYVRTRQEDSLKENECLEESMVGYITTKTLNKWGINLDMGKANKIMDEITEYWVIVKGSVY